MSSSKPKETELLRLTICGKCDRGTYLHLYDNDTLVVDTKCHCVEPSVMTASEWASYQRKK